MSRRAALAIALGALLVPGCDERPVLEWGVALPDGVEADAWVVESRAGCAPGDAVFEREIQAMKRREKSAGRQLEIVNAVLERQLMAADVVSFQWLRTLSGARAVPVGYLSVLSFAGPPVAKPASSLLEPLRKTQPPPPLILDLRGNAGGSLSEAK